MLAQVSVESSGLKWATVHEAQRSCRTPDTQGLCFLSWLREIQSNVGLGGRDSKCCPDSLESSCYYKPYEGGREGADQTK